MDDDVSSALDLIDLTDLFDSGNSKEDNITSITSPRFTGQADAHSIIDLLVDGSAIGSALLMPVVLGLLSSLIQKVCLTPAHYFCIGSG